MVRTQNAKAPKSSTTTKDKSSKSKRKKDSSKSSSKSSKKKSKDTAPTPLATPVEEVVVETPVVETPVTETPVTETPVVPATTVKKRRVVDRDSVLNDFDVIVANLDSEIETVRSAAPSSRISGVKYLRSLNKTIKQLKKDTARAMKQRRRNTNKSKNTSSGFMKPVEISSEMASFTGWEPTELKSRVDVTKYICKYIREKDLQNPADRREIQPDGALSNLLGLTKKSLKTEPLTYYSLQKKIQPHFVRQEPVAK